MIAQPTLQETTLLPLTGREEYLAAFKTRLASKAWGKPIMISGPAGIGKTALLRAFDEHDGITSLSRLDDFLKLADGSLEVVVVNMLQRRHAVLHGIK